MLRRAARSLVPRVPTLIEGTEAAACCTSARQFTSSVPSYGIHIEEEVYNRCAMTNAINFTIILSLRWPAPFPCLNFSTLAGSGNKSIWEIASLPRHQTAGWPPVQCLLGMLTFTNKSQFGITASYAAI